MDTLIKFIRDLYGGGSHPIPLHAPFFSGREKEYLLDCIDSTFVSSVGAYVNRLESLLCDRLGVKYAVAVVNGTSALHIALLVAGVKPGEEVLTQALSFVATANAISYCGASPVFLDVEESTKGLDPERVVNFLEQYAEIKEGNIVNRITGRRIAACVPMHTFGHPCRIDTLSSVCAEYGLPLVEDAAESLGSLYKGRSCGSFGLAGAVSFNGNKIVTSGGGGAVLSNDVQFADRVRYLTTTAKKQHPYQYEHTDIGFNYRMPNINAALACAQLEQLDFFLERKRFVAAQYKAFCEEVSLDFVVEPKHARSNYWLNAIQLKSRTERDCLLQQSNAQQVCTRPPWKLLHQLPMFTHCQTDGLEQSRKLADTLINLPSSVPSL